MAIIKVQLWNKNQGQLDLIHDPIGLDEIEHTLKRGKANDGIFQEIALDLKFIKEANAFIQDVYENEGIEGIIIVNLFEERPNQFDFRLYYTGKVAMKRYKKTETDVTTTIEQQGFEIKVVNLTDVDVDLDSILSQGGASISATPTETIRFHPKKILKENVNNAQDDLEFQQLGVFSFTLPATILTEETYVDAFCYGQFDNGFQAASELETGYITPYGWLSYNILVPPLPLPQNSWMVSDYQNYITNYSFRNDRNPQLDASESGTLDINLSLRYKFEILTLATGGDIDICGSGRLGNVEIHAWVEKRNAQNEIVFVDHVGEWDMSGCGGNNRATEFETKTYTRDDVPVAIGDKFFVWHSIRIYGDYENPNIPQSAGTVEHEFRITCDREETHFGFVQQTEFPATDTECVLVYEALDHAAKWMTDQNVAFESEYFGRTDSIKPYPQDGPASLIAITSGGKIRQLGDAKVFINWTDIIQSLSARHCIGWGVKKNADGVPIIFVEPKERFYDKNTMILQLGCVSDLEKTVSMDYYYAQIQYGYPKLDIGDINGLDEFLTTRKEKTPITQTSAVLNAMSVYKTSGYEIESQRRLINSTKDSNLDSKNFMVKVLRDGLGFKTERNENYPEVENLYDPSSTYNLYFAPARMVRSWLKVLASNVIKGINKTLKFTFGDGNFLMVSRETSEPEPLSENADVSMADIEPLWENEVYTFTHPLKGDQMAIIRANPYGYIRFLDNLNNVKDGYILEVKHDPNEQMGEFELLKVYRKPI